ncbi:MULTISPECIES: hypothetical protein [unclassified Streptomyces]|uniref:hypothetical protein n=1 Tax=unclassified Streptomyces TaxID=2593676 RepID=UPI002255D323|nr:MULTISPECIES: hypothetical protein [unclassified Streptomyces]MCX5330436.1 hypothetical protein [Streptomyces sp. NBC_00140]MCX5359833.1 hypothetical protein [Streptomyces sp. NBC_00124]
MTDRPEGRARRTAEALAYFFTHVEDIRRGLRAAESHDAVDGLLAAVRDDGDVDTAVRRLNDRIRAEGDALGLYGRTRTTGALLAGLGGGGRERRIYLCPHRRCLRHQWADETDGAPPVCDDGTPLRLKSL